MSYVLFRDDPNTHKEVYLTRLPKGGFAQVTVPTGTNLTFETAREGYDFAKPFKKLQTWRVGLR